MMFGKHRMPVKGELRRELNEGHRSRAPQSGKRYALMVLSAVLLPLLLLPTYASAVTVFRPPVLLSSSSEHQSGPEIAVDSNGAAHVTWPGYGAGGAMQIWYADNTSGTWSAPYQLSAASESQYEPRIAVDSNGASHVAWPGQDEGGIPQIWYADNTSGTWSAPARLTTGGNGNYEAQIAVDSNGASHITWHGFDDGWISQIWYADNTPGTWSEPSRLSAGSQNQREPQLAVDSNGDSHITWLGQSAALVNEVWYADNTSGTWSTPSRLSAAASNNRDPRIAVDANGASHVTWSGYDDASGAYQIWYADNTSGAWSVPFLLTTASNSQSYPQIAVDSNGASHINWQGQDEGGIIQIWYADNTSGAWPAAPSQLTDASGNQIDSRLAVGPNGASHVTWNGGEEGGYSQVWYADNTSGAWSTPSQLSTTGYGVDDPRIAVDSNGATHVAWDAFDGSGIRQVWYTGAIGPTVTGVSPASGPNEDSSLPVIVTGSDFQEGATLMLTGPSSIGPVPTTGSGTTLKATLDLTGKNPGTYKATVTNPDLISGHKERAFTVNASTWYLAEGTTAWGFNTYITIENPNNEELTARITYMDPNPEAGAGRVLPSREVKLPPLSQTTVDPRWDLGDADFSTRVECLQGKSIAVDRTVFWTGEGAASPEAHNSIGITCPCNTWYLPEGSSNHGFETWTTVLNPNSAEANLTLTYMTEGFGEKQVTKKVPAYSRATYSMASAIGSYDSSIQVTSDIPVVAERSIYRNNNREGSCSVGAAAPATDYFLAEGTTAWGFTTYVCVQNPNDSEAEVSLTYMTPDGAVPQATFKMAANSRKTVKVNEATGMWPTDLSTMVHSDKPVIAERAMYWDAGTGEACHASIGLDSAHMSFLLPDGQTSNGFETYTCVQNPNPGAVTVRVTYLLEGGGTPVSFTDEIPKNSRKTYNMADKGVAGRASVMVDSLDGGRPVIAERAMYWNSRGAGTGTIGGFSD